MKKVVKISLIIFFSTLVVFYLPHLLEFSLRSPNLGFISPKVGTVASSIRARNAFQRLGEIEMPRYDTYYYHDTTSSVSPWFSTETTTITQVVDGKVVEITTISRGGHGEGGGDPGVIVTTRKGEELSEDEIRKPESRETELEKIEVCRSIMSKSIISNELMFNTSRDGSIYCGYVPYGYHRIYQDTHFAPGSGVSIDKDRFAEGYYSLGDFYQGT